MACHAFAALLLAACSSSDPSSLNVASGAPLSGAPPAPVTPGINSNGSSEEEPCATETNFLTLVCATDADCAPVGYCEPYAATDAGAQPNPELAAASGPTGSNPGPACVDPAAAGLSAASGPVGLLPPADRVPPADAGPATDDPGAAQADAGAWRPIGRCIPYESAPDESAPDESVPNPTY